jgi:hypothetical protein
MQSFLIFHYVQTLQRRNYRFLCYVRRYNISEPGALIGFAGPRVVRDTTGKDEGFQTAEVRTRFLRFYYT